jgi:hypothetical protein
VDSVAVAEAKIAAERVAADRKHASEQLAAQTDLLEKQFGPWLAQRAISPPARFRRDGTDIIEGHQMEHEARLRRKKRLNLWLYFGKIPPRFSA